MKLWDFDSGKFIREIGSTSDYTYFINYWNNNNINYIINANSSNVKIYGINKSKEIYREFLAPQSTWHMSAFVEKMNDVLITKPISVEFYDDFINELHDRFIIYTHTVDGSTMDEAIKTNLKNIDIEEYTKLYFGIENET